MIRDRRRFYRWSLELPCILQTEAGALQGKVVNLSFGGARVEIQSPAPNEGTDLEIILHQKDYSVSMSAHVFYVEESSDGNSILGVEFYGNLAEKSGKLLPLFRTQIDELN